MSSNGKPIPVAVLLGGKGTRLGLSGIPKPMVEFAGRPLIEHTVNALVSQGLTQLVFLTGYLGSVIEDYFGDGSAHGANIVYRREEQPLGTARATRAAADRLGEEFLLVYGDTIFDIDMNRFVAVARQNEGAGTLFAHPNDHPYDSDLIVAPDDDVVTAFLGKPHPPERLARNLVNAGLYYLRSEIFNAIPSGDALHDWGRDVFPKAVREGYELHSYRSAEYIKDIGTPDRLKKAERHLRSGIIRARSRRLPQRAVFLDRDGVINQEIGGVHTPDNLILLDGVARAIGEINQSELLSIVITNQPDIAKGFFDVDTLEMVHAEMERKLAAGGAYVDDLFYCPHHPERGFEGERVALKMDCNCRKPKPGMLREAAQKHNIDLSASFLIGDRISDTHAAKAVGVTAILVHRNQDMTLPDDIVPDHGADHVVTDLPEAWAWIRQIT